MPDRLQTSLNDYWLNETMSAETNPLQVGVELEYPMRADDAEPLTASGRSSRQIYDDHREIDGSNRWTYGGNITTDGSVGTEIVSGPEPGLLGGIDAAAAPDWYADSIEHVEREFGHEHEPVGTMADRNGSTAGLHIHLSPITAEQAKRLFDMSTETWMKVFACSTLVRNDPKHADTLDVFRGGRYCQFNFNSGRYTAVHSVNASEGHWEWRLPEPMDSEHFGLLMEFLQRFVNDADDAEEYAHGLVTDGDERLTSIKRANALGERAFGIGTYDTTIARLPADSTAEFYYNVSRGDGMPYIYRVTVDDEAFYTFTTMSGDSDDNHEVDGVEFAAGDVLEADSLTHVTGSDINDAVEAALEEPVPDHGGSGEASTSAATSILSDVAFN